MFSAQRCSYLKRGINSRGITHRYSGRDVLIGVEGHGHIATIKNGRGRGDRKDVAKWLILILDQINPFMKRIRHIEIKSMDIVIFCKLQHRDFTVRRTRTRTGTLVEIGIEGKGLVLTISG